MVTEQLIVNGVDIPLEGSLNPNLTYSIQDIKRLDKRKATYSKTITLPSSKVLNDLFNFIFEINIDGTFNPNLKADAVYLVDSQTILDGFIKLNAVHYLDNSHIIYKCVLLGSTANFFTDLGEKELTDIQGLNGWDAVILWEAWIKGDSKAKERLCDYNEADVRNLEPLAEHIYSYFYDHYGPPNMFATRSRHRLATFARRS